MRPMAMLTRDRGKGNTPSYYPACPAANEYPMIRHIVFFSAANPANRETVYEGLMLLAQNPFARHFEVGRNFKNDAISPGGPDFIVYAEFEDEAQLAAYKAHPVYQQSIDAVRPLRDMRIAADFLSGT